MKKSWLCLLLSLCLLLPLCACGRVEEGGASAAPEPTGAAPARQASALPQTPSVPNPLSGLPLNPDRADARPVAVMLNDLKAALPQLGVSQADLIYEVPAEGGITRMLALFQDLDGVGDLGSIRSTRTYYMELALGHDAILVHAGGSPEAYAELPRWDMDHLDGVRGGDDAQVFWRDKERKKRAGLEHSMLTSGERLSAYLEAGDLRLTHEEGYRESLRFAEDGTPEDGVPAARATVRFSSYKTGVFDYDAASGQYLVSQFDEPYIDGNTGEQVGVVNVLILKTRVSLISGDAAGRLTVDLDGEGEGTFLCGGRAAGIRWSKPARNDPFTYTLENGTPLVLGEGRTYVCIVSTNSGVTLE